MPALKKSRDCNFTKDVIEKLTQQIEKTSPVDFELPEWLKKKKSFSYTLIKRNIYRTKKVKKRTEDDGIFCSCSDTSGPKVCGKECQCGLLLSSCSSSCKCGDLCLNKPFHKRPVKKMKPVKTNKCGWGLVADEAIQRGEFVIEYVGEVIDDKTCEERLWDMKRRGETNFYLCEINRDVVIDATYKGNNSRFINHCCQPNTEMQKWLSMFMFFRVYLYSFEVYVLSAEHVRCRRIDGETRIGIFAVKDITEGEELTYDYRFVQFGDDQDCHCGATRCRRKLGIKPTKPRMFSESSFAADLSGWGGDGCAHFGYPSGKPLKMSCIGQYVEILRPLKDRCYVGCILDYDIRSKKHLIVLESRRRVILDMAKESWKFL